MKKQYFIPGDAHEGCVWVEWQARLYFSSTKKLEGSPKVSLNYLDFSEIGLADTTDWATQLENHDPEQLEVQTWKEDANMMNALVLANDGQSLLTAEQGDEERPSAVTLIDLEGGARNVLIDNYRDKPFNSINKAKQTRGGHLIFSDPDYGFRQGFRHPPVLEPSLYVLPLNGEAYAYDCGLEMPHGIALSPDEKTLFITDTSADGAHEGIRLDHRRRSVYAYDFDPQAGKILGNQRYCFSVDEGVPDGSLTTEKNLLVGGGDGVYIANLKGELQRKISLDRTAVNLCTAGPDGRHLFITADEGVYIILDW